MAKQSDQVTELLLDWSGGSESSRDSLMRLVHDELRRVAASQLRGERRDHTLQPTALVNEAYLRLVDQTRIQWRNRAQFFGIAAQLMRRILVDHARRERAAKRGGPLRNLSLDERLVPGAQRGIDLVALDEALGKLTLLDKRLTEVVEMRFFGGLTVEETAAVLEVSPATVKRDWATARAWLFRALQSEAEV